MSGPPAPAYLLDTNAVSELARPRPEPAVVARLVEVQAEAAIASVTWHELRFGVDRLPAGRRQDALRAFLGEVAHRFPVLPYDREAGTWHAAERARLAAVGRAPAFADGQIAAIAVTRGLRLVSRNLSDFTDWSGLAVESWWPSAG